MLRREFFGSLTLLGAAFGITTLPAKEAPKRRHDGTPQTDAASRALVLQTCAVAGFQYHHGDAVWNQLVPTQPLILVREPNDARRC